MYLFGNGLIKCLNCGQNYRGKKQRNQVVYICQSYHRDKKKCQRFVLKEEDLLDVITKHMQIENRWGDQGGSLDPERLVSLVKCIEVKDRKYVITYKDGKESIIDLGNEIGVKIKY